jgi:hypothetical protein
MHHYIAKSRNREKYVIAIHARRDSVHGPAGK